MQTLAELAPEYITNMSKLDELLRHYKIIQNAQKFQQIRDKVKTKIKKILDDLKKYNYFSQIEEDVMKRIDKVFNPPKPKPAVKNSKPEVNNKAQSFKNPNDSIVSFSSNSNSNAGGSVKVGEKKPLSPVKKGVSMHNQLADKKSQSSASSKSKAESIRSMKFQNPKVESGPEVSIKSKKIEEPPAVKPVISAMKLVQVQPLPMTPKQPAGKGSSNGSSGGLVSIISDLEVKPSGSVQSGNSIPNSISSIAKTIQKESNLELNLSMMESESVSSGTTFPQKPSRRGSDDYSVKSSNKLSQDGGDAEDISESEVQSTVINFLIKNRDNLNNTLIFNDDLFNMMDEHIDNQVYLFGINKPNSKNISELYGCTVMKFMDQDIRADDKFEKQFKDFNNNIRIPLGLIFKGDGPLAIKPYHIRFLQIVKSPFPVILLVKNDSCEQGTLCSFHQSIIDKIRITPKKQLDQCEEQLHKKTYDLKYGKQNYPIGKNKVITKILYRKKSKNENLAPMAISITGNDCIRQQKHNFHYKVHSKFLPSLKNDFSIYYANNSNVICGRKLFKQKEFEQLKKEVMESQTKEPMILNTTVLKETSIIRKDYFQLLFESKQKRDIFFFITWSTLTIKKTVVLTLKSDIGIAAIKDHKDLQFKQIEKDTAITNYILSITKNNIKDYEASDQGVVQIKSK